MELTKDQLDVTQWVNKHSDQLYEYAAQRVRDREYAKDLVQETFLAACRNRDKYSGEASVKTWLFTILKNKIIDYYRKASNVHVLSLQTGSDEPFFDEDGHWSEAYYPKQWNVLTDERIETKEFYAVLSGCRSKLKALHAIVFTMKYIDNLNSEEICKALSLTSSNYWIAIHRAKVQLRACLEKNWFTH